MEDRTIRDGEPCSHAGCLNHTTHPCEGCGRIAGRNHDRTIIKKLGNILDDYVNYVYSEYYELGTNENETISRILTAIHARLREKITDSLMKLCGKGYDSCETCAYTLECESKEYYSKAIDQVLKILEQELTNGK